MKLYDITPAVTDQLAIWPGDTPMTREMLLRIEQGDSVTLSTIRSTVHLGAHADAPNHYAAERNGAEGIGERLLAPYLGRCEVVTASVSRGQRVSRAHLAREPKEPRVLLRTGTFPDPNTFNEDFAAIDPALLDWLAQERGVQLVGIDTPSVDLFRSKDLPAHAALLRNDLAVLEGITLVDVPDGVYELIALPLKLMGFDASPVRAVLRVIEL